SPRPHGTGRPDDAQAAERNRGLPPLADLACEQGARFAPADERRAGGAWPGNRQTDQGYQHGADVLHSLVPPPSIPLLPTEGGSILVLSALPNEPAQCQ